MLHLHPAMFLATCLVTCRSGDEVKIEDVFLLADLTKHCETSCNGVLSPGHTTYDNDTNTDNDTVRLLNTC